MKRTVKSVLAVLLTAALLLGACSAALAAAKPRYVVLGDSIAYGSGLSNPTKAVYGKIVADTNGYEYENYAIPGHTTQNLLRRLENDKVRAAVKKADIISISIGGNNFLLGDLNADRKDHRGFHRRPRFDRKDDPCAEPGYGHIAADDL